MRNSARHTPKETRARSKVPNDAEAEAKQAVSRALARARRRLSREYPQLRERGDRRR